SSRAASATDAPSTLKARAVAAPIPRLAPVMMATFPARSGVDVMFTSRATFADGVYFLRCPRDERNDVDDRADDEPLHARDRGRPRRRTGGTEAAPVIGHPSPTAECPP